MSNGTPLVHRMAPFNTIGVEEQNALASVSGWPLSGYMGGNPHCGKFVRALEEEWADIFRVKHAIACNSATSGLLMACMAAGVGPDTSVLTTPYTMSATAACAKILGAKITFSDIEVNYYCLDLSPIKKHYDVVISTNLFGQPRQYGGIPHKLTNSLLIEDNAQAIFAKSCGRYAGTFGDIGVFSLNVHKHLQCGEGGVVVTDDDDLANKFRMAMNHGELAGFPCGLNLRMTETTAAIASAQLKKRHQIISERVEIAETLNDIIKDFSPYIIPQRVRPGCTHVYYIWAFNVYHNRTAFVKAINDKGFPLKEGYTTPLWRLEAFKNKSYERKCPITKNIEDQSLVTYENCAYTPSRENFKQIKEAFHTVMDKITTLT